jgi:hypothetical protein
MNMHALQRTLVGAALVMLLSAGHNSLAAVSAEQAAQLKSTLMPLGGEKAGNKDGTIPAWEGGLTAPTSGFRNGGKRPDPYASEKPLFSITVKNMDQYADKLSDGVKAMLKKYPDSYRLDVYPSHRTAAAPQWVYDNTLKNATRAKLIEGQGGLQPSGAYGGVAFPIPNNGAEVIWNHLTRWRGGSYHWDATQYLVTADGKKVLTNNGAAEQQSPFWFKDGSPEKFNGDYYLIRLVNAGPPIRAGEGIAGRQSFNDDKSASWVYITGQRRVRKLPNACCDTPSPTTAGVMTFDEIEVFSGRINRFDWKLLGKKEMYVPYNSNRTWTPKTDSDVMSDHHMNPDHVRWELHRVWAVEADLAPGQRHTAAKSIYYIDEDSWYGVLGDRWDAQGQLWRTMWQLPIVAPDIPGVVAKTFGFYDLVAGTWYVNGLLNEKAEQYKVSATPYPDSLFTPDALAGEGVR